MRKLDFHVPTAKGNAASIMSKQDKTQLANDRQRRERLKRQLRLLYDDVAREEVPDTLMALINQIGTAPGPDSEEAIPLPKAADDKKEAAPE